jgi:hypothetical protein
MGYQAGYGATDASGSSFIGNTAGYGAVNAASSFFAGNGAGYNADGANNSTFIGYQTGYNASNTADFLGATHDFFGIYANSNFLGYQAGYDAYGAVGSTFIGVTAGYEAFGAAGSNFIGMGAGYGASGAYIANFFGNSAGAGATNARNSNFIGNLAGSGAVNANKSNFLGNGAGYGATDANNSNFMGDQAGYQASSAENSNFFGQNAGRNDSNYADFLGPTSSPDAGFLGFHGNSNFIGTDAGFDAAGAIGSSFFGNQAGYKARYALGSTFIGYQSGYEASSTTDANIAASGSVFLGNWSGYQATNATGSVFLGNYAGTGAVNAGNSIFMGNRSGEAASYAKQSLFLGGESGGFATNAFDSVFLGNRSGQNSTNASNSVFIGGNSGGDAATAARSIFIGNQAGVSDTVNNTLLEITYTNLSGAFIEGENITGNISGTSAWVVKDTGVVLTTDGDFTYSFTGGETITGQYSGATAEIVSVSGGEGASILIGNRTSTGGFTNSIALGSFAANTAENQLMIGSTISPIDEIRVVQTGGTQCIIDGTGLGCTSDERLKTNITDLSSNILDSLTKVRTVTYNWKANPSSSQMIGFLAQDLEQYFPQLVGTNEQGQKSVNYANMTPILVEAVRELNLKLTDIQTTAATVTDHTGLIAWFADAANGIGDLFVSSIHAKNELCIEEVCVTKADLQTLVNQRTGTAPIIDPGNTPVIPTEGDIATDNSSSTGSLPESTSSEPVIGDISPDPVPEPQPVPEPVVPDPESVIDPVTQ